MNKIYVVSDTHFNHKNIIEYCNRPFHTVDEMNSTLIKNWNSVVGVDDYVIFLGDFCLGPKAAFERFMNCLNGQKIFIYGNHDHLSLSYVEGAGVLYASKKPINFCYNGKHYLFSHAPKEAARNVHGHIHNDGQNDRYHFNVSVEAINYTPIPIEDIEEYFSHFGQI